jgi:hypothetical protein
MESEAYDPVYFRAAGQLKNSTCWTGFDQRGQRNRAQIKKFAASDDGGKLGIFERWLAVSQEETTVLTAS